MSLALVHTSHVAATMISGRVHSRDEHNGHGIVKTVLYGSRFGGTGRNTGRLHTYTALIDTRTLEYSS